MAANPLSSAAGYFTICEMEKTGELRQSGGRRGPSDRRASENHGKVRSALRRLQPGAPYATWKRVPPC